MLAGDIILFLEHTYTITLFMTYNDEMITVNKFFSAEKVFLNVEKTKFLLFHYSGRKRCISSPLQKNEDIDRVNSIKFLGILLNEN